MQPCFHISVLVSMIGLGAALAAPPANDNQANAQALSTNIRVHGTLIEATTESGELIPPFYTPTTWQNSIWYRWTAPAMGGWHVVESSAVSNALWRKEPNGSLTHLNAGRHSLRFETQPNTEYLIALSSEEIGYAWSTHVIMKPVAAPTESVTLLSVSPQTVDVTSAPAVVTMTFTITHAVGQRVRLAQAALIPALARRTLAENGTYLTERETLTATKLSSTPTSDTWSHTVPIPVGAVPGAWSPVLFWQLNGSSEQHSAGPLADLPLGGIPGTVTVINSGPVDATGPALVSASVDRTTLTLAANGDHPRVKITYTLNDPTGVRFSWLQLVRDDGVSANLYDLTPPLISGQNYTSSMSFVPSAPGAYHLEIFGLDAFGNMVSLNSTHPGFPGPFTGAINVLPQPNTITSPVVDNLTFTPNTVDVAAADATILARFHCITPDGFQFGTMRLSSSRGEEFQVSVTSGDRISGTDTNGIWEVPIVVPRGHLPATLTGKIGVHWTNMPFGAEENLQPWPSGTVAPVIVNAIPDRQAPTLTAYSFSPGTINLRTNPSAHINASVSLQDPAGIEFAMLHLKPRSTGQAYYGFSFPWHNVAHTETLYRTAGDLQQGTWTNSGQFGLSPTIPAGTYEIYLECRDRLGNSVPFESVEADAPAPTGPMLVTIENFPPPTVVATVSQTTVDVSTQSAEVELLIDITAPGGLPEVSFLGSVLGQLTPPDGVAIGYLDPSSSFTKISGNETQSRWRATRILPRGSQPGIWTWSAEVNQTGPPFHGEVGTVLVVNTGLVDTTPPLLTSITIDPPIVDLRQGAQDVTITVQASDDVSGIVEGSIYFGGTNTTARLSNANRIAGTAQQGTWQVQVTVLPHPLGANPVYVTLQDDIGRISSLRSDDGDFPGPFQGNFTIINYTAPELVSLTLSRSSVDVSLADQTVHVTITAKVSGGFVCAQFSSTDYSNGNLATMAYFNASNLVSGTATDGVWEADLVIPKGSAPKTKNYVLWINNYPGTIANFQSWPLQVLNTGVIDTTAPTLVNFSYTVTRPPGLAGPGSATCEAEVTDDLAGVFNVLISAENPASSSQWATLITTANGPRWQFIVPVNAVGIGNNPIYLWLVDREGNEMVVPQNLNATAAAHPYRDWQAATGLVLGTDPLADSDGDELCDLLECAFGTSPTINGPRQEARPTDPNVFPYNQSTFYGQPKITLGADGRLSASWWAPPNSGGLGLTYLPELSTDLENWTIAVGTTLTVGTTDNRSYFTFTENTPAPGPDTKHRWMRIRVDLDPAAK